MTFTWLWWFVVVVSVPVLVHLHRKNLRAERQRTGDWKAAARRSPHCRAIRAWKLANEGEECESCGYWKGAADLELHHKDDAAYWRETPENTALLCRPCHNDETRAARGRARKRAA